MSWTLFFQLAILIVVLPGTVIFFLHRTLVSSTEGAVKRLDSEAEQARAKQAELTRKLKEADEELSKRKAEADELTRKMITEAEEKVKEEREKLVKKAREEGEEIITKAQGTKDKIRKELEKEMYLKSIDYSVQILSSVLSDKIKEVLSNRLLEEFVEGLQKVDMSRMGSEVTTAEIITAVAVDDQNKTQINRILNDKLKREIKVNFNLEPQVIGGVVLKFGSLALDGSLRNMIKESAIIAKQKVENE